MAFDRSRILLVDDDKDSREMLKMLLQTPENGYSITAVGTGAEALALIARSPFDLFILDIWLPGMDGFTLCRRLREKFTTAPIIFFSAMVRPNDRHYGIAAGATEFLVKPNDLGIFVETVERLLNGG